MKCSITFLGGPECGNVGETTFEDTIHDFKLVLPLNKAVEIDTDGVENSQHGAFLAHVVGKARANRFFKVDGDCQDAAEDAERKRLMARADELEIKVDGRWRLERLRTAVQEAEAAL